jgi:glycerol uptake facilitator-like aquaporin
MLTTTALRKSFSELLGTAFIVAVVIGSGIMASRLAGDNPALTLLINSLATGAGLTIIILALSPFSEAHFNPVVTVLAVAGRRISLNAGAMYIFSQFVGAIIGTLLAHLMFSEALMSRYSPERIGAALYLGEAVATFGLIFVIRSVGTFRPNWVPAAVGLYIISAYWFTSSTSFANPAVTVARAFTSSFAGIRMNDVLGFIAAQVLGGGLAEIVFAILLKETKYENPLPVCG